MNIEALGAWGEFLGGLASVAAAIGVIVTLLYLARQIGQSTKSLTSSAYTAFISSNAAIHQSHMAVVDVLPNYIVNNDVDWDSNSVDFWKFHGHCTLMFQHYELCYLLYQDGLIDSDYYEARIRTLRGSLGGPGFYRWWDEYGYYFFSVKFVNYVNDEVVPQVRHGTIVSPRTQTS